MQPRNGRVIAGQVQSRPSGVAHQVEVLRLPGDRATLAGPLSQVDALLRRLQADGRLASASDPVPDGRPGMYAVTVRLLNAQRPVPARSRVTVLAPAGTSAAAPVRAWWTRRRVVVATAAVVTVTLLGCVIYVVVTWITAHLVAIVAVLLLAGLISVAAGRPVCQTVITITHRHRRGGISR